MSHQRTNIKVGTLKTQDGVIINFYELNGWRAVYCYDLAGEITKVSESRVDDLNKFARATLELYKNAYNP